jgi:cell division protein FtsZ
MFEDGIQFNLPKNRSSVIKVIGVGGGGSNAVNHMSSVGVNGVDFIVCNTDAQALDHSPVTNKVQLGVSLTEGLGAGADPEIGREAAKESLEDLTRILETGTKMCFITAGMGGGTGTGAAPVIAKAAKDMGILTIGIITVPFSFEGNIRAEQAEQGIEEMRKSVDSLIVINNDKLRQVYGDLGFRNAFAKADEVLAGAAKGIAEVITNHYTQNIDLRDARTVLENSGSALFGTGSAEGAGRAAQAISAALDSPLLNDNHIKGAKNVLLLLTSGNGEHEVTIDEIGEITDHIQREAGGNANVIMGIGGEEEIGSRITCTIVATGFPTGTRMLPTDKLQVVVHDLNPEQTTISGAPISEEVHTEQEPTTPYYSERVVMDLGGIEEPILTKEPTAVAEEILEEEKDVVDEISEVMDAPLTPDYPTENSAEYEDEDPMAGFPQMPEDSEGVFEQSMDESEDIPSEDEATVHVLEWDMEEEAPETNSETTDHEYEPLEAPSWDLFSTSVDPEEEEIELHIEEENLEEQASVTMESSEKVDPIFDAPAPAKMESPQGMIQEEEMLHPMPEALEVPISEEAVEYTTEPNTEDFSLPSTGLIEETPETPENKVMSSFTLDDIQGEGFTLDTSLYETEAEVESKKPESEETPYDAFNISLNEMPALRGKSENETIEHGVNVSSLDFEKEEYNVEVEIEHTLDPDLNFEMKEVAESISLTNDQETKTNLPASEDMERPLSQIPRRTLSEMPSKVRDRISRLQSFQYQFKSNQQNLNDVERIPAYMRQGLEVDLPTKSNEQPSSLGIDAEGNIRTNNSFLHDNVD